MIEVRNLTKAFGDFTAVNSVSFTIGAEAGIIGLLGPNGAGKTTTMRLLTGYLTPSSGSVSINGLSPQEEDTRVEMKRTIGYLPETTPLYPEMLVSEYLQFMGRVRGMTEDALESSAREMIEKLSLGSHLYTPIALLSKGFRQRTALAGALVHRPKVVILDEPTSGLDPNQIVEIRGLLRELGKEATLILSTHILQEVEDVCERVIIMNRGQITADAKMSALRRRTAYAIVARGMELQSRLKASRLVASVHVAARGEEPEGFVRLECELAEDAPERLFAEVAAFGWEIREFTPLAQSLQQVFRELTH